MASTLSSSRWFPLALAVAALFPAQRARGQAFVRSGVASPPAFGLVKTSIDDKGQCKAETGDAEGGQRACLDALLPVQPSPVLGTPGSFFVGYAWGRSSQFVYGPQVGVSSIVEFPVVRPRLEEVPGEANARTFRRPRNMTFSMDLAVSLNVNFSAFTFPNAAAGTAGSSSTQLTVNAGLYLAPELGWSWWTDDGRGHRVAFAIGVMAGVIDTTATGTAFVLGIQPAIIASF